MYWNKWVLLSSFTLTVKLSFVLFTGAKLHVVFVTSAPFDQCFDVYKMATIDCELPQQCTASTGRLVCAAMHNEWNSFLS